tara:strand:- start:395 stop:637 length:243 start_codon:yes stop_codon:yes gene_type:complete
VDLIARVIGTLIQLVMNNNEEICYPYAYGRLNASLDFIANDLEMDCIKADVNVDEKVIKMLLDRVKKLQKVAVVESYDKH